MTKTCRIALIGECMIELHGEMFGTMQQTFGGGTLNTAVYLARLGTGNGIAVAYATQLGTDAYSDAMVAATCPTLRAPFATPSTCPRARW